jgi:hypothetical protein
MRLFGTLGRLCGFLSAAGAEQDMIGRVLVLSFPIAGVLLSGCAAMDPRGPQDIALTVTPQTATCVVYQHGGEAVGRYDPNRRSITVPASAGNTDILCFAPGYKDKRISMTPGYGGLGLIVDGPITSFRYPEAVTITMEPADRPGTPS